MLFREKKRSGIWCAWLIPLLSRSKTYPNGKENVLIDVIDDVHIVDQQSPLAYTEKVKEKETLFTFLFFVVGSFAFPTKNIVQLYSD